MWQDYDKAAYAADQQRQEAERQRQAEEQRRRYHEEQQRQMQEQHERARRQAADLQHQQVGPPGFQTNTSQNYQPAAAYNSGRQGFQTIFGQAGNGCWSWCERLRNAQRGPIWKEFLKCLLFIILFVLGIVLWTLEIALTILRGFAAGASGR